MRVLVTGGHGFVGRHLQACSPKSSVLYVPSSQELDVRDPESCRRAFEQFGPDLCIHMAAIAGQSIAAQQEEQVRRVNVQGTSNLLNAAHSDCRFVFLSSCHVYGRPQRLPLQESHALGGIGAYAESKIEAESRVFSRVTGDAVVLRLFNLTGPGQSERFALADWAKQSIQGAQQIRTGNLTLKRDYLDVRDAAQGIWELSQRANDGDVVNVCSGNAFRLADLFAKAAPGCRPLEEAARFRADDVLEIRGCTAKAASLGWRAKMDIGQSILDLRAEIIARS